MQDDGRGHKHTVYCPVKKCKYTSRQWNWSMDANKNPSTWSTKCPKHQQTLIKEK
jgi:hypothetical protein